jgi:hypothetical protein
VVGTRFRQTSHHHVGVADRLDLLQTALARELVEHREQIVQGRNDLFGRDSLGARGEVDYVGEEHADVGELIGDHPGRVFEPRGDRSGQDVEQQALGAVLLGEQ